MARDEKRAGSDEMKGVDQTRRALLQAGWVIPAILVLELKAPSKAFAQYVHTDAGAHVDIGAHVDGGVSANP
jgi:hypothetical protein